MPKPRIPTSATPPPANPPAPSPDASARAAAPASAPGTTPDLILRLQRAYPALIFKPSARFRYHPPRTIFYEPSADHFALQTLHELGHATLGHHSFRTDIERLKIERAAWDAAAKFCIQYAVDYDPDYVKSALDSYRDWLHARSRCRRCGLTRYQTPDGHYHCPQCDL